MSKQRESKEKETVVERLMKKIIGKPACFGCWDCLAKPSPKHFYYAPRDGNWSAVNNGKLIEFCPLTKECERKNVEELFKVKVK